MTAPLQKFPLGIRLILMFCMFIFNGAFFVYAAAMLVPTLFGIDNPQAALETVPQTINQVNAFLFLQGAGALGGFLLTAIMFAKLESPSARERLRFDVPPRFKSVLLALFAILVAQLFIQFLIELNSKIPLPPSLSFLAEAQKQNEDITNALLNFKQNGQFIIVTFVMAVLPAICEEFFFRGLFLGDLLRANISPAIAIPVSGFVFAISHGAFNNILAIWVLGSFLGYLYYTSGSLWLSIVVHFTNNFVMVLLKYLYETGKISSDIAETSVPVYAVIISVAVFAVCIFLFNQWKTPANYEDEMMDDLEPSNES